MMNMMSFDKTCEHVRETLETHKGNISGSEAKTCGKHGGIMKEI